MAGSTVGIPIPRFTGSTLGRELFVLFRRFFILALTTPTARHDGPGGHPRPPSRPSDAGRGHQSHPQGSRRPEDNHTEMASLTCGTATGDPHKSPPANPAGHSVTRVCVAGGNGPEAPGCAHPGVSEAAEGRFWHSCTNVYSSEGGLSFWGALGINR